MGGGDFGSSPRLRGTEASLIFHISIPRFIPALAGNRRKYGRRRTGLPVHPRACGEQITTYGHEWPHLGSSPRLRGTVKESNAEYLRQRFIPALAGNSVDVPGGCLARPVHPRACGEQDNFLHLHRVVNGSSPRLRGTGSQPRYKWFSFRFIPALAGNRSLSP